MPSASNRASLTVVTVIALVSALLFYTALDNRAFAQANIAKVAVANPVTIFSQLAETKDLTAKMQNEFKNLEASRIKRTGEISDLEQQKATLKPDSPQWAKVNQDWLAKRIDMQSWMQLTQAALQEQQKVQIRSLYEKITVAIQKVAVQRGIELVLAETKPDIPADITAMTLDELRGRLGQRNVLYSSPTADISDQVVALMDADYKAGK